MGKHDRRGSGRRFSLRSYFDRHPAVPLSLACLAMIYAVARYVQAVMRARGTVHASWAPTVAVGLASSLMLIGVTVGSIWWARHIRSARLGMVLVLVFGPWGMFLVGMMYTGQAVMPKVGPPATVTTGFQLAAIVFMIPLYGGIAALMVLVYLQLARNRKTCRAPRTAQLARPPSLAPTAATCSPRSSP
jgi:hypothetical protein